MDLSKCILALLLSILHCGTFADAATGTALRSAASASRGAAAAAASSKAQAEAGQFFGIHFNVRSTQPNYEVKAQASEQQQQQTSTFSFPGIFGIPQAIASVLGVKPAQQQQQQPAPEQQQQKQKQQKQPQQPNQQKPKQPAKQAGAQQHQQQKKQPAKQQQKQQQKPTKQPADPAKPTPVGKQQQQQQQQQPKQYKPFPAGKLPPPSSSSLIANGPPLQQQQKQHKVYYKKKQGPKSKQPVVASNPSYTTKAQPGTVPMCEWRSDFNECQVHRHFYLALKDKPSTHIAQTITAASARDFACSAHTQPSACQDASQGLRCGWNLSGGRAWDASGCRSYYMAEWTVFAYLISSGVGAAQAATGLTNIGAFSCPGSLAARALSCSTAYPMDHYGKWDANICAAAAPGCIFQTTTNTCVMSPELHTQLALLHPEDVGKCSASCYLRVLDACPAKPHGNTAGLTDPGRCWETPGCTWSNGACGRDLYSSQLDGWGRQVAAAAEACTREKEAWGCGQAGAKGLLKLPLSAVQEALARGLPGPGAKDAKCPL